MSVSQITDHAVQALARLISQYADKPKFQGLVSALAGPTQGLEDALYLMFDQRIGLDSAFGAQLDGIGTIVGEARDGGSDADYRIRIRARVRVNLSSGAIPQIVSIIGLLAGGLPLQLTEYFPAGFAVRVSNGFLANPASLAEVLREAKAAGVRGILEYQATNDANTFVMDGLGLGFDDGMFSGAI